MVGSGPNRLWRRSSSDCVVINITPKSAAVWSGDRYRLAAVFGFHIKISAICAKVRSPSIFSETISRCSVMISVLRPNRRSRSRTRLLRPGPGVADVAVVWFDAEFVVQCYFAAWRKCTHPNLQHGHRLCRRTSSTKTSCTASSASSWFCNIVTCHATWIGQADRTGWR